MNDQEKTSEDDGVEQNDLVNQITKHVAGLNEEGQIAAWDKMDLVLVGLTERPDWLQNATTETILKIRRRMMGLD